MYFSDTDESSVCTFWRDFFVSLLDLDILILSSSSNIYELNMCCLCVQRGLLYFSILI